MAEVIKNNSVDLPQAKAAVLKLADFAAEASSLVLDARREAARIVQDARGQAEEVRRQAAEKGYEDGAARGLEDGLARGRAQAVEEARRQVRAEADEAGQAALAIAEDLAQARRHLLQEARTGLLQMAIDLARKIVAHVATNDITAAEQNLAKALELARCTGELTVLVNPAQHQRLEAYRPGLVESLGVRGEVRLVADPRIEPGGVKVVSRWGEIDATIRTQLSNVVRMMFAAGTTGEVAGEGAKDDAQTDHSQDECTKTACAQEGVPPPPACAVAEPPAPGGSAEPPARAEAPEPVGAAPAAAPAGPTAGVYVSEPVDGWGQDDGPARRGGRKVDFVVPPADGAEMGLNLGDYR